MRLLLETLRLQIRTANWSAVPGVDSEAEVETAESGGIPMPMSAVERSQSRLGVYDTVF